MTVRVYRSTDPSAPILNGTAGSLIAVLDACLVNGYGTATSSGWIKAYTGTNVAAYQTPSGNLRFLRVDDTIGAYAKVVGYESMTDVNTGVNPFPTVANYATGFFVEKLAGTAGNRPWAVVATQTMFYMLINTDGYPWANTSTSTWCFGDIISFVPADTYNTVLCAQETATSTSCGLTFAGYYNATNLSSYSTKPATAICRPYNGSVGAVMYLHADNRFLNERSRAAHGYPLGLSLDNELYYPGPDPIHQALAFSQVTIVEYNATSTIIRGILPGAWALNNGNIGTYMCLKNEGPTFTFTAAPYAGKSVERWNAGGSGSIWIETSNTW